MIYDTTLRITYAYASSVADAQHALLVRPRNFAGQTVSSVSVLVDPKPDETGIERDFFGNSLDAVALWRPHTALSVVMRARITVGRALPDLSRTASPEACRRSARTTREIGNRSPMWFLGQSRRIAWTPAIADYVRTVLDGGGTVGEAVLALAARIRADFTYRQGATDVGTSVAEAFETRLGVCQDFAHVMIAGLRANGIPAGYVSGFLRTDPPPGQPRLEGADAMHAWVTVWLGEHFGWVDFDPTNGVVAGNDHIVVAVGRDYADVAPVAGVLVTIGPQMTGHTVDVVPVETDGA